MLCPSLWPMENLCFMIKLIQSSDELCFLFVWLYLNGCFVSVFSLVADNSQHNDCAVAAWTVARCMGCTCRRGYHNTTIYSLTKQNTMHKRLPPENSRLSFTYILSLSLYRTHNEHCFWNNVKTISMTLSHDELFSMFWDAWGHLARKHHPMLKIVRVFRSDTIKMEDVSGAKLSNKARWIRQRQHKS